MKKLIAVTLILALVAAVMIPVFASADSMVMWVNCSNGKRLNLRAQPDSHSARITLLENGTKLEVIECLPNGWMKVTDGRHTGYVLSKFLQDTKPGKYQITERSDNFVKVTPYMVTAQALNGKTDKSVGLRASPNKDAKAIRRLAAGDQLEVIARGHLWSKVIDMQTGKTGYVANDYIAA